MQYLHILSVLISTTCLPVHGQNATATILSATLPVGSRYSDISYPGGDHIYLFGGCCNSLSLRAILRFTISIGELETVGQLPSDKCYGTTFMDNRRNIFLVGGSDRSRNDVILKFDTTTFNVEEIPTRLPPAISRGAYHEIVSYQKDISSPAYLVSSLTDPPVSLYLMKFQDGVLEIIRNYPLMQTFLVNVVEVVGDDVYVMCHSGFWDGADVTLFHLKMGDPTISIFAQLNKPVHSKAISYGDSGLWYLLPWRNPGANVETFDVNNNTRGSVPVLGFPEFLRNGTDFNGPSYVFVEELKRMYIFGGYFFNRTGPEFVYLSMIWTIDFSP